MPQLWKSAVLVLTLATLVPAAVLSEATAPQEPASLVEPGESACPLTLESALTPEPTPSGAAAPNEYTTGPCYKQTVCPSPSPGVLGRSISCWGDFYCNRSVGNWVECDYSRTWC